jgi:nucleotide-binding universal stress UspA family protein
MSILCGTDLTEASAGALAVAHALAARRGDHELVLVHVIDDEAVAETARAELDRMVAALPPRPTPQAELGVAEAARAGLDAQAATLPAYPTVRTELVIGPVDETLVAFAEAEGSELIVIAASSRTGGALLGGLGSTAERVIATTRIPVLAVRDPAPWLAFARDDRRLRVLLGVDASVAGELGTQWTHALRAQGPVDVVLGAVYYPDEAAERFGLHAHSLVDR